MPPRIAHGGGLIAARAAHPDAPSPWLDLSTGINPVPYPLPPLPTEAFTRLPESEEVAGLERLAAAAYGAADPAMVVAAPGTQSLIQLLPRLVPARRVAVIGPTYAEHAASWAAAGCRVTQVADATETGDADVAVVCNPNNPDGRVTAPGALLRLAAMLTARGGMLVVDEAFADFEDCSLAATLPVAGVVLLRSFGKAYGLAGLRLGFAVAPPGFADALRVAHGPWAVSGPAVHAGRIALPDAAWRIDAAARLTREAAAMDRMLGAAGLTVVGGTRLFRLVSHPDAGRLAGALGRAGVLVRRFEAQPHWLRFGVTGPAGLARAERALANAV